MVILCYDENNKIYRYLTCDDKTVDKALSLLGTESYKLYHTTDAYSGLDIRAVTDEGSILPISKQVELGYLELAEDEKLEGETIVKLSQKELEDKFPDRYPKPQEPTDLEKIEGEIESLEVKEGYRLLREMGRNRLLEKPNDLQSRDIDDRERYKNLLEELEILRGK